MADEPLYFPTRESLRWIERVCRQAEALASRLAPDGRRLLEPVFQHVRIADDTDTATISGVTYYAGVVLGYANGVEEELGACWFRAHDGSVPGEDDHAARLAGVNLDDGLPLFVAIAGSAGGGSGTLATVEEDDGSPSVANAEVLQFDDEWFAVTEPVAGTALVKGAFMKKIATRVILRF